MKNLISTLLMACTALSTHAATSITTPTVSGHWTLAGSPYKIFNDVAVDAATPLIIDPGVEVIIQGHYTISVPYDAHLVARGTATQYISFKASDTTGWSNLSTTAGGWAGIIFDGLSTSPAIQDSALQYCNISDLKQGYIGFNYRSARVKNCNFFHNHTKATISNAVLSFQNASTNINIDEISQCHFYNNHVEDNAAIVQVYFGAQTYVRDCEWNDNKASCQMFAVQLNNFVFERNQVHNTMQESQFGPIGAITAWNSNGSISNSKIYQNTNTDCAAIVCHNSFVRITRNMLCNNSSTTGFNGSSACGATQGGGAIRLSADDTTLHCRCTITNNVIANNFAAFTGGAMYIFRVGADIVNNQITHNSSGNDPLLDVGCPAIDIQNSIEAAGRNSVRIKNNIFYQNQAITPERRLNLAVIGADSIEYTHNWTSNPYYSYDVNAVATPGNPITFIGDTTDNIAGTNPGLIDPTTTAAPTENALLKNFDLLATSPCIDMGDTAHIHTDSFDVAHHPRLHGSKVDIGAYEYGPWPTLGTSPQYPIAHQATFTIYPNPAHGNLHVSLPEAKGKLAIWNMAGTMIAEDDITNTGITISLRAIPPGVYIMIWQHDGANDMQKLVIN